MQSALLISALTLASLSVAGTTSGGESELDSRWVPWLGCWELVDDERREPLIGRADPTSGRNVPSRGVVCLDPAVDGKGVSVSTAANGETFLEETLIADGRKNPSAKGNCSGWQRTDWSTDGHRLFTSAELTCEENRTLTISGLSMMVPRSTWVEVQIVESKAGRAVVLRRYRPADARDIAAAGRMVSSQAQVLEASRRRMKTTDPMSVDDIAEAASAVAPEAVEAAVLENEEGYSLDAATLMALDDAGVRPGLIDLMVALSYPEKFVVKRSTGEGASGFGIPGAPTYMTPLGYSSFYRAGFSPFGVNPLRTYPPGFFYPAGLGFGGNPYAYNSGGRPYYLTPFCAYYRNVRHDADNVVPPIGIGAVRQGLVSRQGYAQVSERPTTTRRARFRNGSGGGNGGSYSAGSGSSSSSGTVSSSGYSRSGSGSRSAKPRNK